MSEWRPIETAPRDAQRILVAHPVSRGGRPVKEAWWAIPYEGAPDDRGWWQTMDGVLLSSDVHKSLQTGKGLGATHWMPLPNPPPRQRIRQMSECPRKDWYFLGCKFQPRYDERPREGRYSKVVMYPEDMREFMTLRRYVRDVCTRCGKTIERPTKEPTNG